MKIMVYEVRPDEQADLEQQGKAHGAGKGGGQLQQIFHNRSSRLQIPRIASPGNRVLSGKI